MIDRTIKSKIDHSHCPIELYAPITSSSTPSSPFTLRHRRKSLDISNPYPHRRQYNSPYYKHPSI